MNRTLIRSVAFKKNPLDKIDSSSINSMDQILSILEFQGKKQEDPSVVFGKDIVKYKAVRYLNDKHILARDHRIWLDTKAKLNEFFVDSLNDYDSYMKVKQDDTSHYSKLAEMFVKNDLGCIQSLDKPFNSMMRVKNTKVDYGLPQLLVPPASHRKSDNPFTISTNLMKRDLNILAFLPNDPAIVRMIQRHQQLQGKSHISPKFFNALLESYSLEGQILFRILLKRLLASKFHDNDKVVTRFSSGNFYKIKIIVGSSSNVFTRLNSLRDYKRALQSLHTTDYNRLLTDNFNVYFAFLYRERRQATLDWFESFLKYYADNEIYEDFRYNEAMNDFRHLIEPEVKPIRIK